MHNSDRLMLLGSFTPRKRTPTGSSLIPTGPLGGGLKPGISFPPDVKGFDVSLGYITLNPSPLVVRFPKVYIGDTEVPRVIQPPIPITSQTPIEAWAYGFRIAGDDSDYVSVANGSTQAGFSINVSHLTEDHFPIEIVSAIAEEDSSSDTPITITEGPVVATMSGNITSITYDDRDLVMVALRYQTALAENLNNGSVKLTIQLRDALGQTAVLRSFFRTVMCELKISYHGGTNIYDRFYFLENFPVAGQVLADNPNFQLGQYLRNGANFWPIEAEGRKTHTIEYFVTAANLPPANTFTYDGEIFRDLCVQSYLTFPPGHVGSEGTFTLDGARSTTFRYNRRVGTVADTAAPFWDLIYSPLSSEEISPEGANPAIFDCISTAVSPPIVSTYRGDPSTNVDLGGFFSDGSYSSSHGSASYNNETSSAMHYLRHEFRIDPESPTWEGGSYASYLTSQNGGIAFELSPADWEALRLAGYGVSSDGATLVSSDGLTNFLENTPEGRRISSMDVSGTFEFSTVDWGSMLGGADPASSQFIVLPGVTGTVNIQTQATTIEKAIAAGKVILGVTGELSGWAKAVQLGGAVMKYGFSAIGAGPIIVGALMIGLQIKRGRNQATTGVTEYTNPRNNIYTLNDPQSREKLYRDFPEYKPKDLQ